MPRATASRPLTVKQTKFAAAVAAGAPKAVAHRENYASDPKYAMAARRQAAELAQQPHVAAEIRRLTWLSCPPMDDIRGMREHAVRVIADLTRSADSDTVRLNAALALYKIAETARAASNPAASTEEQDKLLTRLRGLYHSIQATAANPPVLRNGATAGTLPPLVLDDDEPIDVTTLAEPAARPAGQQPATAPGAAAPPAAATPPGPPETAPPAVEGETPENIS